MYMQGFKCRVTNASPVASRIVGRAKPAVWCEGDPFKCVKGPKQVRYLGCMPSSVFDRYPDVLLEPTRRKQY